MGRRGVDGHSPPMAAQTPSRIAETRMDAPSKCGETEQYGVGLARSSTDRLECLHRGDGAGEREATQDAGQAIFPRMKASSPTSSPESPSLCLRLV